MAQKLELGPELLLPSEFPYDFNLPPTSTETQSEEETFLAELTHQLIRKSLHESLKSKLLQQNVEKSNWVNSGSTHLRNRSTGSSNCSPNVRISSSHLKPINYGFNDGQNNYKCQNKGLNSSLQFEQQNVYQPLPRWSMRTGFIGKSAGTGVFLPRRYGGGNNPSATRNKPVCSPANFPARMVQELNNSFDDFTGIPLPPCNHRPQPRFNGGSVADFDKSMVRMSALLAQEGAFNLERRLLQEWTYQHIRGNF